MGIEINISNLCDGMENLIYQVPESEEELNLLEGKFGAVLAFSNTPYDDFIFFIFAALLEKHLVFFSKNITIMTFTM